MPCLRPPSIAGGRAVSASASPRRPRRLALRRSYEYFQSALHALGSRLRIDAARQPVANATLGALVDDRGHAPRRWLVLGVLRHRSPGRARCHQLRRLYRCRARIVARHGAVPDLEEVGGTPAALRLRAALLGHSAATGSVLFPVRPFHHRVRRGHIAGTILPRRVSGVAVLRGPRRRVAGDAWYALSQRRARGIAAGRRAWLLRCVAGELSELNRCA